MEHFKQVNPKQRQCRDLSVINRATGWKGKGIIKEHLGLDEISGIQRKINLDKMAEDRAHGKRNMSFFPPMEAK
jgi:hypothetical protein